MRQYSPMPSLAYSSVVYRGRAARGYLHRKIGGLAHFPYHIGVSGAYPLNVDAECDCEVGRELGVDVAAVVEVVAFAAGCQHVGTVVVVGEEYDAKAKMRLFLRQAVVRGGSGSGGMKLSQSGIWRVDLVIVRSRMA